MPPPPGPRPLLAGAGHGVSGDAPAAAYAFPAPRGSPTDADVAAAAAPAVRELRAALRAIEEELALRDVAGAPSAARRAALRELQREAAEMIASLIAPPPPPLAPSAPPRGDAEGGAGAGGGVAQRPAAADAALGYTRPASRAGMVFTKSGDFDSVLAWAALAAAPSASGFDEVGTAAAAAQREQDEAAKAAAARALATRGGGNVAERNEHDEHDDRDEAAEERAAAALDGGGGIVVGGGAGGDGGGAGAAPDPRTLARVRAERNQRRWEAEKAISDAFAGPLAPLVGRAESPGAGAEQLYQLGSALLKGVGMHGKVSGRRRAELAFPHLMAAAERGYAIAQYYVGLYHAHGDGVPRDMVKAAWFFRRAAERGDADAQWRLAHCLLSGEGVAAVDVVMAVSGARDPMPR